MSEPELFATPPEHGSLRGLTATHGGDAEVTPAKRMRRLASVIAATALLAAGLAEPSGASHDPLPSSVQAVAFLVNGYGGCCIPGSLGGLLAGNALVAVHVSNWNHFDQGGNPGAFPFDGTPDPFTDESLVSKMSDEIAALPADTKVILIGHSFGADSILQVAKRIGDRRIAFLAVLDAVGRGGLRTNVTYPVPANVDFLFNRWQTNLPYPIDFLRTGRLESRARVSDQDAQNVRRTPKCKVKYLDPIGLFPELMLHAQMPKDSCIQAKLKRILEGRIFNPNPRVDAADPVFGQSVLRLRGVVIRFSEPIDPATFGLADVVESPSTLVGIEGFPGIDDRVFVVRFNEIATPPAASPLRLTIGPDIRDLDGNPMDQDLDLLEGETAGDRYTFEYGLGGPTPPVELPTIEAAKMIWRLEGRLRIIVSVVVHFDRPLGRSIAVHLGNYSLISLGADRRLGTADDRAIALSAAAYDAGTRAATLTLATPLRRREPLRLIVEGTGLRGYATKLALAGEPPNQDLQIAMIWVLNDYSGAYHRIFVSGACIPIPLTGYLPIINPRPDPWINSPTPPGAGDPTGGIMAPSACQGIPKQVPGRYLKVDQVRMQGTDSQYLYVSFDLKKRVTRGLTQYTVNGQARGRFHLTRVLPNEACIQPASGQAESLDITSLSIKDIPGVSITTADRENLEATIKSMYPKQFCVPRPPEPAITIRNAGSEECYGGYKRSNTVARFTVKLSNRYTRPVSVAYRTVSGTAIGGSDYRAVSGTLTVPVGQTTAKISVTVVCDTRVEGEETFFVRLSSPVNATIADGEALGTIIDPQE